MPSKNTILVDEQIVDLKIRPLAALLAWAVPGLGHIYQGRYAKAGIFFICIASTWICGFLIGGNNVVYASFQPGDTRWQYCLQAGVGLAALPAFIQYKHMNNYTDNGGRTQIDYKPKWRGYMAPPWRPVQEKDADQVAAWYAVYGAGYEMGTWYTVIAGLLNILVIYDAYGGPLSTPMSGRRKDEDE
jgi:hypothetical protein